MIRDRISGRHFLASLRSWTTIAGLAALGLTGLVIGAIDILAAPGDPDPEFGSGGTVTTDFSGGARNSFDSVTTQIDGKLVLAGVANVGGFDRVRLYRRNADGSADTAFGGGEVGESFGPTSDYVRSVAVQTDGKILVAGGNAVLLSEFSSQGFFAVARFLPNGQPDRTFGANGVVTYGESLDLRLAKLLVQSDQKLLLVGYALGPDGRNSLIIVRLNVDGTVDTLYGLGGRFVAEGLGDGSIRDAAIQSDGKPVLVGTTGVFPSRQLALFRILTFGNFDGSFNPGGPRPGVVTATLGFGTATGDRLVIDETVTPRHIYVTGGAGSSLYLARFLNEAALDTLNFVFGAGFLALLPSLGGDLSPAGLALQPSLGRLLILANNRSEAAPRAYLIAVFTAGFVDTTLGVTGRLALTHQFGIEAQSLYVVPANGQIFVAGTVFDQLFARDGIVFGRNPVGTPNFFFNTDGLLTLDGGNGYDEVLTLLRQDDGRFVAFGISSGAFGSTNRITFARYLPSGALDSTFGIGGRTAVTVPASLSYSKAGSIQSDGAILAASSGGPVAVVVRLTSAGLPDPSFGSSGVVTLTSGDPTTSIQAIRQLSDGAIVATGLYRSAQELRRLRPNGTPDPSFGSNGVVTTTVPGGFVSLVAEVMPDGSVVLGGPAGGAVGIASLTHVGLVDSAFNPSGPIPGLVTSTAGYASYGFGAIRVIEGGTIAVAGLGGHASTSDALLFRVSPTGVPLPDFGASGIVTMAGNGLDRFNDVVSVGSGRLIAVGISGGMAAGSGTIARFTVTGGLDSRFGVGGVVTTTVGRNAGFNAVTALDRDRIAAAGTGTTPTGGQDFLLVLREGGPPNLTYLPVGVPNTPAGW